MKKRLTQVLTLILASIFGMNPLLALASGKGERTPGGELPVYRRLTDTLVNTGAANKPSSSGARRKKPAQNLQQEGQSRTLLPDGRVLLLGGQGADGPSILAVIQKGQGDDDLVILNGLRSARTRHSATLLPDGSVLILGGIGVNGRVLNKPEMFDSETQKFKAVARLDLTARASHTATVLTDGQVLIVGGVSENEAALSSAELFNPKTRSVVAIPARMSAARQGHTAMLLPDGRVLLRGGKDDKGQDIGESEIYDPETARFIAVDDHLGQDYPDPSQVAATLPANGEDGVPTDCRVAIRFSSPVRVDTVNIGSVTLASAEGAVAAKVLPVEEGRLVFVTPRQPLLPNRTYTVSIAGLRDSAEESLAFTSFAFTTIGDQDQEHSHASHHAALPANAGDASSDQSPDDDRWIPDEKDPYDNWRSNQPESPWQKLAPLEAVPGVTALAGQVLKLNGSPLANVTLQIGDKATRTDSTGRFLISGAAPGRQSLLINGSTASRKGKVYGSYVNGVDLAAGQTTTLLYTIWLSLNETRYVVRIPVPTKKEVVVTNPQIPGLEIRIPAGVRLRAHDGSYLKSIAITAVPADRTPVPVPPGTQLFFSPQTHGAKVETVDGSKSVGVRIIYPNVMKLPAGSKVMLFDYDPKKGWYVYGEGSVTADGKQVVPDPGAGLQSLRCTFHMNGPGAPSVGPKMCALDGDPVDLSTGLFLHYKTDLVLPDTIPIVLDRTYRPNDSADRPFGKGATNPYDIYLWFNFWNSVDLVLPDGAKIRFDGDSSGYECTTTPGSFYKSTITSDGVGYNLKLRDGTIYHFLFKEVIGFVFSHYMRAPLQWIQDPNGNRLEITRDNTVDVRMTRINSPNGKWVEFSYDGSSPRITQARDNIGRTVSYAYDASGRLWKVTDPVGGVEEYMYDSSHRMLTVKNERGIVQVVNEYDANGRVSRQTLADGGVYQFAYTTVGGNVTQAEVTNPRNFIRSVTFDSNGYPLTDTDSCCSGNSVTYERQAGSNLLLTKTDALGRKTAYTYDAKGNLLSLTELAGTVDAVSTSFTYDSVFNQVTSVTDPLNRTTTFSYDSKGNLTSVTDPLNYTTTYAYNATGQVVSVTNALNQTTHFGYEMGDNTSVTNTSGHTATRFVDGAGRMVRFRNPQGQAARIEYDALNRPTRLIDPLQGQVNFSYDPKGNLLRLTDARNNTTAYTYDPIDRVASRTDSLGRQESYLYNLNGNLSQVTDRKGQVTSYIYDSLDRLTQVTYHDGSTITYTYDSVDRLTQVVDSLSGTISYTYDNLDRLTSETTPQGAISYNYDAACRLTSMTVTGQPTVSYTYDNADRLTGITQGAATITIAYDATDRRTHLTLPNGVVTEYSYDGASRLIALTYKKSGVVLGDLTYQYDVEGRVTKMGGSYARTGLPQALATTSYNAANQQTAFGSRTLTYDLNGNLTSDGVSTYTWDARNQLVSISEPGLAASFRYDASGRRTHKTVNGVSTTYLYSGTNIVQEKVAGVVSANVIAGGTDEVFTRSDTSGTASPIRDALGSTIALTDATGALQTSYTYEPFGKATENGAASGNVQKYTGREDDETGLYYYRARYYSPTLQRFVSEDPIEFPGGLNLYAYVENDPINSIDPIGFEKLPANPSGLSPEWKHDPSHRDPNGSRYRNPSGDYLDYHKGRPGKNGWKGKDHWHHNGDKKHLRPGDDIPDPTNCPFQGSDPKYVPRPWHGPTLEESRLQEESHRRKAEAWEAVVTWGPALIPGGFAARGAQKGAQAVLPWLRRWAPRWVPAWP